MVDRWTSGDRGIPLRADHHAINAMVSDSIRHHLEAHPRRPPLRRDEVDRAHHRLRLHPAEAHHVRLPGLRGHQHPAAPGLHDAHHEQALRLLLHRPGRLDGHPAGHVHPAPGRSRRRRGGRVPGHRQLLPRHEQPLRREHDGQRRHVPPRSPATGKRPSTPSSRRSCTTTRRRRSWASTRSTPPSSSWRGSSGRSSTGTPSPTAYAASTS